MGLISSLKSNLQKFKKWPFILTESSQTRISESERYGPNSPRPGLTSQPKRSPDDPREPPKPLLSPHDQSPVVSDPLSNARVGRGFSYEELKNAGMSATEAKQIGIFVDTRRRNKSAENLSRNVQRLKEYKQKIVILKKGAACDIAQNTERKVMALAQPVVAVESQAITEEMKKGSVYQAFHMARANVKFAGQREKRRLARLAAEEEKKSRKK